MKSVVVNKATKWLLLFIIGLLPFSAQAQQDWKNTIDSVFGSSNIQDTEKIKQLSVSITYLNYEGDTANSKKYASVIVSLARKQKDYQSGIYAYSTQMLVETDVNKIVTAMDSCLWYIDNSDDPLAKSIGYDRIGKRKVSDEEITYYLKALKEVDGKQFWDQKREVYHDIIAHYVSQKNYLEALRYGEKNIENARKSEDKEYLCMAFIEQAANYWEGYKEKTADQMLELCNEAYILYDANNSHFTYAYYIYTLLTLNYAHAYAANGELDKALPFANRAYEASITMGTSDYIIPATLQISDILKQKKDYAAAEAHVEHAYSLFDTEEGNDPFTSELTFELASICAYMGKYREAAEYYREGIEQLDKRFRQNNERINEHMVVSYQIEKKENERLFLEEQLGISRKYNIFYLILFGILLLSGVSIFMFLRYKYIASSQVAQMKKSEADILRMEWEKSEMQEQLYKEQEKTHREIAELKKEEVEDLQKKLMMKGVLADHKSKTLEKLKDLLLNDSELGIYKKVIERILNEEEKPGEDTENTVLDLKTIHPDFYNWLQQKANNKLTDLDLKYCSCIYMKMSSKEMADIFKVDPKTVRVTKYRLKQKLGLSKDEDLNEVIEALL